MLDFVFTTVTTELALNQTRILNLTTVGLLAVISGFNTMGTSGESFQPILDKNDAPVELSLEESKTLTTKEKVIEYFTDIPVLVDIARCESRFTHVNKDGSIHRGEITPADVGVMQINEKYHLQTSKKLGYDIYTLEGNLAYARYLYEKQGARPWLASSHCWAKYSEIAKR